MSAEAVERPCHRGTTNSNDRGSSEDRRRRREWLVTTFRANVDLLIERIPHNGAWIDQPHGTELGTGIPACRCYRCGKLLIDRLGPDGWPADYTVTVDRIIPGAHGGTYRRNNIRPACGPCNSETGAPIRRKR